MPSVGARVEVSTRGQDRHYPRQAFAGYVAFQAHQPSADTTCAVVRGTGGRPVANEGVQKGIGKMLQIISLVQSLAALGAAVK